MNPIFQSTLAFGALVFMMSCSDNDDITPFTPSIFESPSSFEASIVVEVVDKDGQPVADAAVSLGKETVLTDANGLALLLSTPMSSSSYVVVEHENYFHGSRRFYPTPGALHRTRIMVLRNNPVAIVLADEGGEAKIGDAVTLHFDPNSVVTVNGDAYDGVFAIRGRALRADDPDVLDMMPGDLVGRNLRDEITGLETFGMVAVELVSETGEQLQIAEGSSVELTMTVPEELRSFAPSTIPLWYFDEVDGMWKEEGSAVLMEEGYVGAVTHFTYWNCDMPYDPVKWGVSFINESGPPSLPVLVCLTNNETGRQSCRETNSDGIVCELVPADLEMTMEVYDVCGELLLTQTVGPYTDSAMIGPFTLPELNSSQTVISGIAVNCNNELIEFGVATVSSGGENYVIPIENGVFTLEIPSACFEVPATIQTLDAETLALGGEITISNAGEVDLGTIVICGESITDFMTLQYGTIDSTIWLDTDSTSVGPSVAFDGPLWQINAFTWQGDSTNNVPRQELRLHFDGIESGGVHEDVRAEIVFVAGADIYESEGTVEVSFVSFGTSILDVCQGTYSGQVYDLADSSEVDVSGSFRVLIGR